MAERAIARIVVAVNRVWSGAIIADLLFLYIVSSPLW